MRGVRGWALGALAMTGLLLGAACEGEVAGRVSDPAGPSARQREARSDLLRDMVAQQEPMPAPEALDAQREQLRAGGEGQGVGGSGSAGQEGAAPAPDVPTLRVAGTIEGVEDSALRVRDGNGVSREVRVDAATRYVADNEVVERGALREGAQVRVFYDPHRNDGVAREVEVVGASEPGKK